MVIASVDAIVWLATTIAVIVVVVVGGAAALARVGRTGGDRDRLTELEKRVADLERDRNRL
jgi:hypothetical protein